MKDFSYITQSHPAYIEGLYKDYIQNPESVDPEFRKFFEGFDFAISNATNGHAIAATESAAGVGVDGNQLAKEFAVYNLILAYRKKGHLIANTNPIRKRKDRGADLDLKYFGLNDGDLQQTFGAGKFIGLENASLQQIVDRLKKIYCGHI
jgi:2-oxoglutarate dehydrogenase E1 component